MKSVIIKTILITLSFMQGFSTDIIAQQDKIPVNKLQKDIKFYFSIIKKVHPDAYAYATLERLDSVERKLIDDIREPISPFMFARKIELETNSLFDSHTRMYNVFDNPLKLNYPDLCLFFPWEIELNKKDMYLIDKHGKQKIISINKHSVEEIISNINKIFSADISDDNKKQQIENYFPFYYFLIYFDREDFDVSIIDSNNHLVSMIVKGDTEKVLREKIKGKGIYKNLEPFELDIFSDSIALLTINTFEYLQDNIYSNFLQNSFKTIAEKSCKYLFIDIRSNGGGSSENVALLLDYLYSGEYKIWGYVGTKRYSKEYLRNMRNESQSKNTKKNYNKHNEYVTDFGFWERTKAVDNVFNGNLFLLQGYKTASASLDMSSAIKASHRGLVIGKPTGEPACSYSQGTVFKMPNSKLTFQCATGFFVVPSASSNNNEWIQPDIDFNFQGKSIDIVTLKLIIDIVRKDFSGHYKKLEK